MRRVLAVLACCLSPAVLAAPADCVDIVGGPSRDVLDRAEKAAGKASQSLARRSAAVANAIEPPSGGSADDVKASDLTDGRFPRTTMAQAIEDNHAKNLKDYRTVARWRILATTLSPPHSCDVVKANNAFDVALGYARYTAKWDSWSKAHYGVYVGPNYSLGGAGDWRAGAETLFRVDTEIFTDRDRGYDWLKYATPESGWIRGYTELSYQTVNALDEVDDATGGEEAPGNVFASAGGYLRLNTGLQLHFTDWLGLQLGGGLSSLPNADDVTRMEPRAFGGLHFQTLFQDGALGSLFLGAAYDQFWEREVFNEPGDPTSGTRIDAHFERYVFDTLLFLPGQLGNLHLVGRLYADAPWDGEGPSDVRVSILLYYDFNDWLNSFLPIRQARDSADVLSASGI